MDIERLIFDAFQEKVLGVIARDVGGVFSVEQYHDAWRKCCASCWHGGHEIAKKQLRMSRHVCNTAQDGRFPWMLRPSSMEYLKNIPE